MLIQRKNVFSLQAKRSQAILEFFSTYGWMIVVLGLLVGTFMYFGILDPSKLVPTKCQVSVGFICKDYNAAATNAPGGVLEFILYNDAKPIILDTSGSTVVLSGLMPSCSLYSIQVNGIDLALATPTQRTIEAHSSSTISVYCPDAGGVGQVGQQAIADFDLKYQESGTTLGTKSMAATIGVKLN